MTYRHLLICCFYFSVAFSLKAQNNYLDYVNPFIGTGGHGHTYPGATVPHGMVQLSPDTRLEGWDGCGGYHYSDTFIYGFSHTHLSGTGVSDYGDILMMPTSKDPSPDNRVYGSAFTHRNEKASPGYYCVQLDDDDIITEFTATERVGYHHYVYSSTKEQNIILDLKHRDEVIESSLKIEDSVTVSGMRRSKAWANDQYVFFVIRFSSPIRQSGIWEQDRLLGNEVLQAGPSKNLKAFFRFKPGAGNEIFARVAISPVSVTGAMANLLAETGDKSFLEVRAAAEAKWNTELSKIDVKGNDEKKMRIFYTALYHTAIVPTINMDVDGSYRGRDGQVHKAEGFTYYSVFSLWDTYRAAHPLYTLIDPVRNLDYIKTFLVQYQQGGRLPVWELSSCETDCMIGYHSVSVMADAFVKGIKEFDTKLALKAMVKSASWNHFGLPGYIKNGVINTEDEHESVSKTLEYAYDDYCIAMFAKGIGETEVYNSFIKRAQYYKNILDVKSGFMRPRKNGGWLEPFDPYEVNNHFTEANSWQYSFYFPQDIDGYLKLVGGPKILEKRLDALFTASQQTTGREQSDISGLIGQYAHGNEPSHHIAYLYDFTSRPSKTQSLVHQIMTEMYKDEPDGLIGNEDCGQMSAWYVMSALGFYPVTPGTTRYMIGTPQFNLAEIHLENDRSFIINAPGVSDTSFFIQSALLSTTASLMPKKWEYAYLDHFDITGGGLVTFMMGNKPANCFPKIVSQALQENKSHAGIILNPSINGGGVPFKTSKLVTITSPQKNIRIYYTLDGKDPGPKSLLYARPLSVTRSMMIKAVAIDPKGNKSFVSTAEYKKMPNNWTIRLNAPYEKQFDGGGTDALIDGIRGTTNWRMGNWQGYQKTDPEIVIDLKEIKSISKISIGLLQDTKSWIVLPKEISVEVSTDGRQFRELYKGSNYLPIEDLLPQIKDVEVNLSKTNARFIKVKAVQYGKLPSWHEGAGGDTHIFLDEIDIK